MISEDRKYRLKNIIRYILEAFFGSSEKAVIKLGNDSKAKRIYSYFNKRNKKFFGIKRLTISIALIDLSKYSCFEDYRLTIRGKNSADYYKRRCEKKGYTFRSIDRNDFIDEIYEINTSLNVRCGKEMTSEYKNRMASYNNENASAYGVFKDSKLVAYTDLSTYNQLIKINRILGHGDFLNDNIMYYLLFKTIESIFELNEDKPGYFMYDSFWGNPKGLVLFKNRFKFCSYKVKWLLK